MIDSLVSYICLRLLIFLSYKVAHNGCIYKTLGSAGFVLIRRHKRRCGAEPLTYPLKLQCFIYDVGCCYLYVHISLAHFFTFSFSANFILYPLVSHTFLPPDAIYPVVAINPLFAFSNITSV